MDSTTTRTAIYFFRQLLECSPKQFCAHLYHASSDELRSLQRLIKAYLSGTCRLNSRQVKMLAPYASLLRQLCKTENIEKIRSLVYHRFDRDLILSLADPFIRFVNPSRNGHHDSDALTTTTDQHHKVSGHLLASSKGSWTCEYCNKAGHSTRSYKEHLNTHRKYCDLPFVCTVCSKKYASSSALSRHKSKCHSFS